MKIRILVSFIIYFLVNTVPLHAQSWQWGKRGGSDGNFDPGDGEYVKDMATDRNGNIYVLANAGEISGINIDGQVKTGFSGWDVILASFRCNGTLRWVKIMGGRYDDAGLAIGTDNSNGVYVSATLMRNLDARPIYIDGDTAITDNRQKNFYLIKYDTSGNLKWVLSPQPDTVTATQQAGTIDMSVDSAGNIYALCQLPGGEYGGTGGFVVTPTFTSNGHSYADCMLKYDRNGNFLGGFNWDTKGCFGAKIIRDEKSAKYYMCGFNSGGALPLGSTTIASVNGFIACFDKDGKHLWNRQSPSVAFFGRPALDKMGHFYMAGNILQNGSFNGYTAMHATSNGGPFIIKMDTNANNIWAADAIITANTYTNALAIRNEGEVVLCGHFPALLSWPGYTKDTLYLPPNSGYMPYITRFNTQTGKVLGMEKLSTDGNSAYADIIMPDGRNNVYLGGEIKGTLTVNGNTIYNSGGRNDWFVAKYGHNNCGCTNIPEPTFSFNRTSNGKTSTTASPVHVYDSLGTYTVCVKVTNSCGDNTYCAVIPMWPAGINETQGFDNLLVYPNPIHSILIIEGLPNNTQVQLSDITGRLLHKVSSTGDKTTIDTDTFPAGVYILQLTDGNGNRTLKTIVK